MEYVTDMSAKRAELTPDGIAFRDLETGRAWTFVEVDAAANRFAHALGERGISSGERVGILCQNRPEFFVVLFACLKAGVILVPLNWRQPSAELAPIVESTAMRLLIHDAAFAEIAAALAAPGGRATVSLEADAAGTASFAALIEAAPGGPAGDGRRRASDIWYLLHTSGTTGLPKAVIYTFGMAWVNAVNIGQAVDLVSADTSLNFLPLFHTAGINLHTLPLFLAGGMSYVTRKFEPEKALELIGAGQLSVFFGVPAIYQSFSLHGDFAAIDFARVRSWGCGGAPLPETLVHLFAGRGARICNGFGMTETGPTVFLMDPAHAEEKIGSVGKAQMLADIRIVGPDNAVVAPGASGELQIRGPGVTPGYFGSEAATRAAFTDDGWLRTGDVARTDPDGYTFIVDRIKDMYISGGENVYPAEVERILMAHPDILEAAVVGVADEKWGEVGVGFLLRRPGKPIDTERLPTWCRERLAAYKVPKRFCIVDEFPRTAAGKVRKNILKDSLDG